MIGSRLVPYEITPMVGEDGIGEVCRATDTKLDRDVAIEVLPQAFAENKERLARFEREAQLLAQLHHPKVASMASRSGSRLLRQARDDRNAEYIPPGDPRRIRQPARRPNH